MFIREIETVINLLIYLVNQENVNLNDIEILTLFVAQQYFLKKEIMSIIKVFEKYSLFFINKMLLFRKIHNCSNFHQKRL